MLLLTSPSDRLQIITSAAGQLNVHATWVDTASGNITPGRQNTSIVAATTTSVAGTPPASTQRNVKTLHITNIAGAGVATDVTVVHTDGTTAVQLYKLQMLPGDSIEYTDQGGWAVAGSSAGGWITGDIRQTYKTTPDPGWILVTNDGTIGNAASGATNRANADTRALFTLLWAAIPTLKIQDQNGVDVARGGSAAADYDGNRRMFLPKLAGRVLASAGVGPGLTGRTLGDSVGSETQTPTYATMASHVHDGHGGSDGVPGPPYTGGAYFLQNMFYGGIHGIQGWVMHAAGGGQPFGIMSPTTFVNTMIKL